MSVETLSSHRCFGGTLNVCRHSSVATGTPMRFTVFLPSGKGPFPALTFLAGLTCTEENFTVKAGAYRAANELGLAIVAPDTSPRGPDVTDDEAYDLGQGAGFYIDATEKPWAPHFSMETYVIRDLAAVVRDNFPVDGRRQSISGHSMGGHGALTLALKYPEHFRSVSAFALHGMRTSAATRRTAASAMASAPAQLDSDNISTTIQRVHEQGRAQAP